MSGPLRGTALASMFGVLAGGALLAAALAGATGWWILTDPATLAATIESRDWTALATALARGVVRALF